MQAKFSTSGDGYWSDKTKSVTVTGMALGYVAEDKEFGELRVYFNTADWDVDNDGLIYTDSGWLIDLRNYLAMQGLNNLDVEYSEQGMQGDDYVSLDVGAEFIAAWEQQFGYDNYKDVHVTD